MKAGRLAVAVAIVIAAIIATGLVLMLDNSHGSEKEIVVPNSNLVYDGTMQELVTILDTDYSILFSIDGGEYTSDIPKSKDAGTIDVSYRVTNDDGKEKSSASFKITIAKRSATIAADTLSKTYGEDDPVLTTTTSGIVEGDQIPYSISRDEGESVGIYAIHLIGETVQDNYEIVFKDSTMTIKGRPVIVVADDQTKSFGSADPELTSQVTGLLDGDSIEYSIYREIGEDSGSYKIIVSGESIQGNYVVDYQNGVLYIYAQIVTVHANNASKVFGDTDPTLTATVTGGSNISYTLSR